MVLEAGRVELQGAGVLGDDAGGSVREAVLLDRADLDRDLQVYAIKGGEVLDDLLIQPVEVAAEALRIEPDRAEEARVPWFRGSGACEVAPGVR